MVEETAYDAQQIQVLEGLQAVRKRPAMYVGSIDNRGLHHLVHEVVDNSIDEAMAGFCKEIQVTLNEDGSVTVADDGRGIPVDLHPKYGVPGVELVLTRMHTGGKFEHKMYRVSGGLHGVGLSVVNGLSESLEVRVRREGKEHRMRFERGQKASELEVVGPAEGTGTIITFRPDPKVFETIEFEYDTLAARLRELAFLNAGLRIIIVDKIRGRGDVFQFEGGIAEYVKWINRAKSPLHSDPIRFSKESDGTLVEVAMQYHDGYNESIFTFVNNIDTIEGGTHLVGFKAGLARAFIKYAKDNKYVKSGEGLEGDDVREGLTAILSLKIPEPQFEGQRDRRVNRVRETHGLFQRDPEGRGDLHREGRPRRPGPRGRAQGAGADPAEGPPRRLQPAREAGGLPGAGSREERAVYRGRAVGRRVRETRTPPGVPGDPSLTRENPKRREGPHGSDAEERGDSHAHHGDRRGHRRGVQR